MKTSDISPIPSASATTTPKIIASAPAKLISDWPRPLQRPATIAATASTVTDASANAIHVRFDPKGILPIMSKATQLFADHQQIARFRDEGSPRPGRAARPRDER